MITLYQDVTIPDSNAKLQLDAFLEYHQNLDERMIPILSVLLLCHAIKFRGIKVDYQKVYNVVQKLLNEMQKRFVQHQKQLEQLETIERDGNTVQNLKKELEQCIKKGKSFSHQIEKLMPVKLGDLLRSVDSLKTKLTDLNVEEIEQERRTTEPPQVEVNMDMLKNETFATFPTSTLAELHAKIEQNEIPSTNVVHEVVIKLWIFLQNLENPMLFQYLKPEYQAMFRGENIESENLNPSLKKFAIDFHKLIQIEIQNFLCIQPFWTTLECLNKMTHMFVDSSEELKSCDDDSVRSHLLSELCNQLDHNSSKIIQLEKEGFPFTDDLDKAYQKMERILRDIVSSTSEEVDKKLRDGVIEVENYLKKSEHLNIMRKSGRDILSQDPKFKPIKCCSNKLCQCFSNKLCQCCKRHINAIPNNPWWYGGLLCFRTILGNLKSKPGISSHFNVWFVASLIVFPLFIITSHTGYILVAWLTEPDKTTSLAFLATGIILFLFIMTRALYTVGKNYNSSLTCCKNDFTCSPKTYEITHMLCVRLLCPFIFPILYNFCEVPSDINNSFKHKKSRVPFQRFSMTGFYIAGSCGFVAVGFVSLTVSAFIQILLQTVSLPGYLQNIVQIIFVLIAALVSYKVLNFSETDAAKFLRQFVNRYLKDRDKKVSVQVLAIWITLPLTLKLNSMEMSMKMLVQLQEM